MECSGRKENQWWRRPVDTEGTLDPCRLLAALDLCRLLAALGWVLRPQRARARGQGQEQGLVFPLHQVEGGWK